MLPEPSRASGLPAAVVLDPMSVLLRLDAPVPRLVGSLAARGVMIDEPTAVKALTAVVEAYRAEHLRGVDQHAITELREHSARALQQALPEPLDDARAYQVVMGLLRFQRVPGAREPLEQLRAAGVRIGFASDWDNSLHAVLLVCGIADLADAAVCSAQVGAAKPSPQTLRRTIELLGVVPTDVLVIGDDSDAAAAAALGADFRFVGPGEGARAVATELLQR